MVNDLKLRRVFLSWYGTVALLILCIVVVGGLTRLTGSGLSMVNWSLFMGMMPPITMQQWMVVFDQYQSSPEYQLVNYQMTLSEFKVIFLWEYAHRMLGRLIGLSIIVPYIIFAVQKKIPQWLHLRTLGMIVLVSCQGAMGWYMVKSGLVDVPMVSHFRLASHLLLACLLLVFVVWTCLDLIKTKYQPTVGTKFMFFWIIGLIVQVVLGAFTAGLKAGHMYNTYPKMGDEWIPQSISMFEPFYLNIIKNPVMIQFVHRHFAILLACLFFCFAGYLVYSKCLSRLQKQLVFAVVFFLTLQVLLGIFVLVFHVPIVLASLHQVLGVCLLLSSVFCLHALTYKY